MQNMKTTAMMIEFLIAGVMVIFALIVLALSIFPNSVMNLAHWIRFQHKWMSNPPFVILVFISVSYGFGIFVEAVALHIFEPLMKRIKENRIDHLIQTIKNINKKLIKKPIDLIDLKENRDGSFTGIIRYYVLQHGSLLYQEIETQHHRLRITRVFCLFIAVVLIAIGYQYIQQPKSITLSSVLILLLLVLYKGVLTVQYRFQRYCQSIERAYKTLLLESPFHKNE